MTETQSSINLGDVEISYRRSGSSKHVIVLLHGFTDDGGVWKRFAGKLTPHYDVLMPDARGHGQSSTPETGYDYPTLASDLIRLVRALELKAPVVIGHSMGAETAALAASLRPGMFSALVLEDPPWSGVKDTPKNLQQQAKAVYNAIEARRSLSPDALFDQARENSPHWHPTELVPWVAAQQRVRPIVSQLRLAGYPDWRSIARRISCPCLLLTGENRRGSIVTPEIADEAMQLIPKGQHVQLDTGHCIHRDDWEQYLNAVSDFVGISL